MSNEFNFDDLDKAVSSLVGDQAAQSSPAPIGADSAELPMPAVPSRGATAVPSRSIPQSERAAAPMPMAAPTVEQPASEPTSAPPAIPEAQPESESVQSATAPEVVKKPAAEKPNSGRFMDMKQPGGDSKAEIPPRNNAKRGSAAEGRAVTPLSDDIKPDPLPEDSAANTVNSAQLSIKAPVDPEAMTTTPDTEEQKWQDPLEVETKKEQDRVLGNETTGGLSLSRKDEGDIQAQTEDEESDKKPLFLPDAKVEKRPLGAFSEKDAAKGSTEDNPEGAGEKNKANEESAAAAKLTIDGIGDVDGEAKDEANEPLPPELGKEIIAVEAGGEIAGGENETKSEDKKDGTEGKEGQKDNETAKPSTFSIPKQYQEKPASTTDKPKSIYDTDEYQRSLATAASKKGKTNKGLFWGLIVLGLLVVGVGLGIGVYFLVGS